MKCQLTPASQRAVEFAAGWTLRTDGRAIGKLSVPALLLGLLSESECRASAILADCGIDIDAVRRHWPSLLEAAAPDQATPAPPRLSREIQISLELAQHRLADLPQPLEMATEHILLGLATSDHEAAVWLREQGLDPDRLDAEIHAFYGLAPSASRIAASVPRDEPMDVPLDEPASRPASSQHAAETTVLRILDAAANRAREGLRVIEDFVRFVLDDAHLTAACKEVRHDLTAALARLPAQQRLAARETQQDVGTGLTTAAERRRDDLADVVAANFARLQESLRSLEEYGKVVDGALAAACKALRYRIYTLQRAVEITRTSLERLCHARLYVLLDGRASCAEFRQLAGTLVDAGVAVLQLRDKRLGDRDLLERARLLRELTAPSKTLMIVNDRPDLAALSGADGVHVGQEELSVKDARTIVGPDVLIGVSTHSIEQARQAVLDGADYIGVGPTFPSGTKRFDAFPGVALLHAVAAEIRLPAFAIGGIALQNVDQVLVAGFTRIAVSGSVVGAADPAAAVQEFLAQLAVVQ